MMNVINDNGIKYILSQKQQLVIQKRKYQHIQPKQLMHVFKLHPDLNIFFSAECNKIRLFNDNYQILQQFDVDLNIFANVKYNNFTWYSQPQFKHVYFCKGIIYIHAFHLLLKVEKTGISLVTQITHFLLPEFTNMARFGRSMFVLNDELYVSNVRRQLLILNNDKLKYMKEVFPDLEEYHQIQPVYHQLDNNVYMLDHKEVRKVKDNLQLQHICDIGMNNEHQSYVIDGILVVHTQNYDNVVFVNMLTKQHIRVVKDAQLMAEKHNAIYDDTDGMFRLKQKRFKQYFGDDFKVQIDRASYNFKADQLKKYADYRVTIDSLLSPLEDQLTQDEYDVVQSNRAQLWTMKQQKLDCYLKPCQLMLVVKLRTDLDISIAIEDNFIYIFDHNLLILDQINIDFDFYAGKNNKTFNRQRISVNQAETFQCVISQGVIYLQAFENLFKLNGRKLEFVTVVPNTDSSSWFTPTIFTLNDQLYTFDHYSCIHVLHNGSFKKVNQFRERPFLFPCFFGKVVLLDQHGISMIKGDFQKQFLVEVPDDLDDVSLMHGGTFINHEQMSRTTQVIDMIHGKHRVIQNDESLHKDNIFSILEVGKSGLKLKDSKLVEIFGKEYPKQLETYYNNFINNQQQRYPAYNKQVDTLLTFLVLFQYFQKRVQQKIFNISQKMNKICNNQASIETKVTQSIISMKDATDQILQKFQEFNRSSSNQ
ncbi:Conserved_hypothetical protein [Hexamita inflata]|uniref:Uncharacterized protein n=1 Tax=Hexamita inflata TaxID=28002 RepID=A0AA86UEK9_9EUKA|nr:Conserved hypothetical protein [Hexamita inflata]